MSAFLALLERAALICFKVCSSQSLCLFPIVESAINPGPSATFEYKPITSTIGASRLQYTPGWLTIWRKIVPAAKGTEGAGWTKLRIKASRECFCPTDEPSYL